jgi:hypothetical protein
MTCRICHRTRDEASLEGWGFFENTLCEECGLMKRAFRNLVRSGDARRLFPPQLLTLLRHACRPRMATHG